jgi:hypothetical protein
MFRGHHEKSRKMVTGESKVVFRPTYGTAFLVNQENDYKFSKPNSIVEQRIKPFSFTYYFKNVFYS